MKHLVLIFHPQLLTTDKNVSQFILKANNMGYKTEAVPLEKDSIEQALLSLKNELSAVVIAGGDGSLNLVTNLLINLDITSVPLAVIPWGTTNDFADQVYTSAFSIEKILKAIKKGNTTFVDIGEVNNRYFLNVAGAGLLVDVAHKTSDNLKQRLGRMAYYIEGARSFFPTYKPFAVKVENKSYTEEAELLLFLILNTKRAGGLRNLAPLASFNDGKLDILLVKNTNFAGMFTLIPRIIKGMHIDDHRITYYQADELIIHAPPELSTDIDGEPGPSFPLFFKVLPQKMKFFTL